MNITIRAALLIGASLMPQYVLAQDAAAAPEVGLGDIIVTAQKRAENLQDVPVAVTAFNSEQIQNQRIQNVADLGTKVPSLLIVQNAGGDQPLVVMRGSLSVNPTNPTADGSTSFYMDGVYLGNFTGSLFDISDVERIEVIRGPAGTLFGTNATAGAVNYITSGPKGKWYARQDLTYSRFDSFRSKTRVDLPEWNGFSVSASYLHNYRGNNVQNANVRTFNVDNASINRVDTVTTARKLGWSKTDAFHGAIRYQPFSGLDINYKFDYSKGRDSSPGAQIIGFADGAGGDAVINILSAQAFFGGPSLDNYVQQERATTVYNDFSSVALNKIKSHFLSLEYQANNNLTIKNITSWRALDRGYRTGQLDGAGGVVLPDGNGVLQPFSVLTFGGSDNRRQFSNETQFIIDTDPVSVTAGLFYYNRYTVPGTYVSRVYPFTSFPNYVVPGGFAGSQRNTFYRSRQIAGYGQATYHVTKQIDLTGGIRYTQDAKTIFDGTIEPGKTSEYNKGKYTWLANVTYKPDDDIMMYAKYTTGFVAGGLSALQAVVTDPGTSPGTGDDQTVVVAASNSYKEETAKSFEAGIKADFFDRRLRANLAAFYVKYGNLQVTAPISVPVVVPSGATVSFNSFGVTNVGKSRSYGIEYELSAIPVEGLTITATGAYNNFKFIETPPGFEIPIFRPKFTANLGAQYEIPVSDGMRFSIRGDAEYKSSFAVLSHGLSQDPVTRPYNARADSLLNQDQVLYLNARATLSAIPLGPTIGRLSVWGRNLTNHQRVAAVADLGTVITANFGDPTTYGVDFTVEF